MRRFKHLSKSDRIRIETLNNDGKAPKEIALDFVVAGGYNKGGGWEFPTAGTFRTA